MLSKKLLATMLSLSILTSSSTTASMSLFKNENIIPNQSIGQAIDDISSFKNGGPVDLSIANEEKIIEMLKKEGKIDKDVSYEEARKIFIKYMQDSAKANENQQPTKMDRELKAKQNQKVQKYKFDPSQPDTNPKEVNVLTLLVDFQDYKHNSIQPDESDMYYGDYSHKHFEDMIFGEDGYEGPNGEKFVSMKQFYEEQSGGSLKINGKVAGWYTLPQAAAYYGAESGSSNDIRPRNAVAHALQLLAKDPNINLADFDKTDRYDLDGDGNLNESDGIIDHLMVIHAGVGQEAGGGSLGSDAIWSHRWNLGGLYTIPGTNYKAYDYTIEPEDGAAGVFAHEFGHDLGLPDEYDTNYTSSSGEPISMWSIMSSGSWAGKIGGTEPTGFSPYAKQYFQANYGGNWQKQITLDYDKISRAGTRVNLKQASEEGQAVRINLPEKQHVITKPASGQYAYWGGKGHDGAPLKTNMISKVDLTKTTNPVLNFKTWYDIEEGWDFATVQVKEVGASEWSYVQGNITTDKHDPQADVVVPHGITGASNGWVDGIFDLSGFAGKNIEVKFEYETDSYSFGAGFYVDDIKLVEGTNEILSDNAEGTPAFIFQGFEKNTGSVFAPHYYLVEWRNHHGVDKGLSNIGLLGKTLSYDPGMVVWYVDEYHTDNWRGVHPGEGFLGVVDADQKSVLWRFADGKTPSSLASGRYQMHDAAFSKYKEAAITVNTDEVLGRSPVDEYIFTEPNFDDSKNYSNTEIPTLGSKLTNYGLKIQIAEQAEDNSWSTLVIKR
ncbi:immune inhibitor A domain-containing protein [Clostridium sp.]|uniref:immune inhibitor A domain-containing protein n=1 Tax=Clostridium sp. TaxID=1506 RepID=UPI002FCBDED1